MPVLLGSRDVGHLHEYDDRVGLRSLAEGTDVDQAEFLPAWQQLVECGLELGEVSHPLLDHHIVLHSRRIPSLDLPGATTACGVAVWLMTSPLRAPRSATRGAGAATRGV